MEKEVNEEVENIGKDDSMPVLEDNNPVAHITKLYEENKFLKQQLHNISRLEIILEVLRIGNWDKHFETLLRDEVKKAFGLSDDKEDKDNK